MQDQIQQIWRNTLVVALQERYSLAQHEAEMKVDLWLQDAADDPPPLTGRSNLA